MGYTDFSLGNFVAFNFSAFACIAVVVFLSSTQPFFLHQVIGVDQKRLGNVIGTLGVVDELASIVSAPVLGTLSDKISNFAMTSGYRLMGGTKLVQSLSFLVLSVSLVGYEISTSVGELLALRCLFAVGVTGCMSMVTVMLNELSNSDFKLGKKVKNVYQNWFGKQFGDSTDAFTFGVSEESSPLLEENEVEEDTTTPKNNGVYAALIGISTGLGAIFAVSCLLTLPNRLSEHFSLPSQQALKYSYIITGCACLLVMMVLLLFSYDSVKSSQPETTNHKLSYFQLLAKGVSISKHSRKVQLAFCGLFVSRSTTVITSVFIPLLVYNFYYNIGKCSPVNGTPSAPSKEDCHDAYIFAAILTGVSQLIALISSPLWGWLADHRKVGSFNSMLGASFLGLVGSFGLCFLGHFSSPFDPRSPSCFIAVGLIGVSQIGIIITSMAVIGSLVNKSVAESAIGSVSGLYSLSGGIGILIISKVGGSWSDLYILAPFFLLGVFNLVLLSFALLSHSSL